MFHFTVATHAELWIAGQQQLVVAKPGFSALFSANVKVIEAARLRVAGVTVRSMTISAADIVSPVLTSAEVVVFFLSRVTGQAGLRNCFRAYVLKEIIFLGSPSSMWALPGP